MPLSSMLSGTLALLLLQEAFLEAPIQSLTEVEGQDLDLHCMEAGDNSSVLQWSNPHHFVIFLGDQKGLKDRRYKLINSSKDHLSVRVSNVTTGDEGLYTCQHYGVAVTTKQVNVTILAVPSKPLLEESTIRVHGTEEKMLLRCSTWGSKPPPQITWLLDNGVELSGDTQHQCESNGKKCNASSILIVHTFNQKSTITCVVRHQALGTGNLTAAVHLSPTKSTTDMIPTTSESGMTTLEENSWHYPDNMFNVTEGDFRTQRPSSSSKAETPDSTTDEGSDITFNITQGSPNTQATPTSGEARILNFTATNTAPDKILNVTEGNFSTQTPSLSSEAATLNSNVTSGTNLTHEGIMKKKPRELLPILVAVLLSVLFVIVLLLVVKLWKAHREWKRENDSSELTPESYKVRPNEDENRHANGVKSSKKRAPETSCRTSKNSDESNESVFEKQITYIKETDL